MKKTRNCVGACSTTVSACQWFFKSAVNRLAARVIVFALLAAISLPAHAQVTFSTPPSWSVGNGPIFVADFNDDGKPDILSASGNLSLGNGNGTFTTGITVTGTTLAVADFNGDGKPDLLQLGTGSIQVLLGNGDGTFQAPVVTNIGASLTVVGATDLNGDGKADVVGIYNNTILVYLATGGGSFAAGVPYALGTIQNVSTALIEFGDFNGDGKTDVALIVAGAPGEEVVLLGNGDGTLQPTLHTSTGVTSSTPTSTPSPTVLGDFNGDGKLDIATLEVSTSPGPTAGSVFLLLGNGDGTFQAPETAFNFQYSGLGGGETEFANLAAADLNKDGKLDLVVTADVIGIYLGNGNGTFSSSPNNYEPLAIGGLQLAIADFNLDGNPDIAFDGQIFLGNGNGTFRAVPAITLGGSQGPDVVGAFVTNGPPGVAVIPSVPGTVNAGSSLEIYTNDGSGNLSLAHTYTLPQVGYVIATADLNGDGNLDLVVEGEDPTSQNWSYMVLLGNGDGSFQAPVLYQQSAQTTELVDPIVIADFNNDHKPDLAFAQGKQTVAVLLGNGDGTFGAPNYVFDGDGGAIVSADFNADGNLDIAEDGTSGLAILLGNGNGTFQNAAFPITTSLGYVPLAGDLNGDGKIDLVIGDNVFLGNGNGTFNAVSPFGSSSSFTSLVAIALDDFNGDGKLDVLAIGYLGAVADDVIYLGKGDGTFNSSPITIPYCCNPPHISPPVMQVADMNGDGKPDLVVENYSASLFVLLNTTATAPGFTIGMASGSSGTATISAGSTATFNLMITPAGSFSGTVGLTCTISPTASPAPICSVPASVSVTGGSATPVMVTVSTTAAVSTATGPSTTLPRDIALLSGTAIFGVFFLLIAGKRRFPAFAAASIVLALIAMAACGGSSSTTPSTGSKGTPDGTYTATVTASSGSVTHNTSLTVVVQ